MYRYPKPFEKLIGSLQHLPGVGRKTAERLAFHLFNSPVEDLSTFSESLLEIKSKVRLCAVCRNLTDEETCVICTDPTRDDGVLCVVEQPKNLIVIENSGGYRGRYHVLLGVLSPIDGIGPDDLEIESLTKRLEEESIEEVITATSTNVEGEATANYLAELLKPRNVRVTRIAQGIPMGSDLDYADANTMAKALAERREV